MTRPPNLCSWCFRELGDVADQFNGGVGHPECVSWIWDALSGGDPDAMPWAKPVRLYREDPFNAFLERLGKAAVRRGINPHELASAVQEACHG